MEWCVAPSFAQQNEHTERNPAACDFFQKEFKSRAIRVQKGVRAANYS
jgi:hypothetical protein